MSTAHNTTLKRPELLKHLVIVALLTLPSLAQSRTCPLQSYSFYCPQSSVVTTTNAITRLYVAVWASTHIGSGLVSKTTQTKQVLVTGVSTAFKLVWDRKI